MLEEKTLDIVSTLDGGGNYVVKDYDNVKKLVSDFVTSEVNSVVEIHDDTALKCVKETRTSIRKKLDAISQARISINALLMGTFNNQLKDIETMLKEADATLKAKVDAYNTDVKGKVDNKPKVITLVIKGYDPKVIAKAKEHAIKLGLQVEEK